MGYVIVEIYNHAAIITADGYILLWRNEDDATKACEAISARNTGVFQVQPLINDDSLVQKRTHGYRLSGHAADPLKVTGCIPLAQTMYTRYADE